MPTTNRERVRRLRIVADVMVGPPGPWWTAGDLWALLAKLDDQEDDGSRMPPSIAERIMRTRDGFDGVVR